MKLNERQTKALKALQTKAIKRSLMMAFKSMGVMVLLMIVVSIVNIVFVKNPDFQIVGAFVTGCAVFYNLIAAAREQDEDIKAEIKKIILDNGPDDATN